MTQASEAVRKAAILVSSLERDVADHLLDQLDEGQSQEIRNAILAMSSIEVAEELDAIRDFLNEADAPGRHEIMADDGADSDVGSCNVDSNRSSLDRASDRMIADCLCDELPQTIAVALSQLPTQRASEVVSHLPATVQADVLERLVQLEPTASLDLTDVREDFQSWLTQQLERSMHRAELAARLATILDATGSPTRERIIHNVATSDARLAKELRHRLGS